MVHDDGPVGLDGALVVFDDERLVSGAGIALAATLAQRLGIEGLIARFVRLRRDRPGAANPGRKAMALIYAMLLGADSIEDCEVLHIRLRKGKAASSRGVVRFADELIARLEKAGRSYSISVRLQFWVPEAIAGIPESAWQSLDDYPEDGEAQIAEAIAGGRRLIVRRTRLVGPQVELWPDWRHFPFITNRTDPLEIVEAEHRQHAVVGSRSAT